MKYAKFNKNVLVDNPHTIHDKPYNIFSFVHAWLSTKISYIKEK